MKTKKKDNEFVEGLKCVYQAKTITEEIIKVKKQQIREIKAEIKRLKTITKDTKCILRIARQWFGIGIRARS